MSIDRVRAEVIARVEIERRGWLWKEPVRVKRRRRWLFFGPIIWEVHTNTNARGMNARIEIEDASERILKASWLPR